jgi:DNA-binding GntR family transcriptional regulator
MSTGTNRKRLAPAPLARVSNTFAGRSLEVLRGMILDGELLPGERLNEVELARALGISRGPLREAIQRLTSDGLVVAVSHRGAYVRSFDAEELGELYEVRIALETHAVRLAARRADGGDLEDLREMLQVTEAVLESESASAYPTELDFHQRVVALAGNSMLLAATVDVHHKIQLARARSGRQPVRARRAFEEHRDVLAALRDGDEDHAAALMTAHLEHSLQSGLALLRQEALENPEPTDPTSEEHP